MKAMNKIIFILCIVAIVIAQGAYIATFYSDDKNLIAENKAEIVSIETRITQLEERLKLLPETQKQLELLNTEKTALLNTIPTLSSISKEVIALSRYLTLNHFMKTSITQEEEVTSQEEMGILIERKYTAKYVGTYEDSRKFIQNLNAAYQIVNIQSVSIDNSVQEATGEDLTAYLAFFGADFNKVVNTEIQFSVFARANLEQQDDIYQPYFGEETNIEDAFTKLSVEAIAKEIPTVPEEKPAMEVQKPAVSTGSDFDLDVGDILTSGDTYKLLGPGEGGGGYVGLVAQTNTYITLSIHADGYELAMEDETGQVRQINITIPINQPKLNINSTMRQVQEVMPNVHVYIYNYTDQLMEVNLRGSLTHNIFVYNEFDERVTVGKTKGNIKLTE